jgi:hypothetical protein
MSAQLKLENSLALHNATLTIAKKVMFQVKQIEQVESKKFDSELTKAFCKLVHAFVKESVKGDKPDLSKKQAEQIDKKAVVLLALQEVFSLTPEEVQLLDSQVVFILENKLLRSKNLLRKAVKVFCPLYKIVFGKLKDQRRMLRNFRLGKGFALKHDQINDIKDEEEGGSILTKILMKAQKGLEALGKSMEKEFKGFNPAKVGFVIGHDVIGRPLSKAIKGYAPEKVGWDYALHGAGATGGKINAKKVGRKIKDAFEKVGSID